MGCSLGSGTDGEGNRYRVLVADSFKALTASVREELVQSQGHGGRDAFIPVRSSLPHIHALDAGRQKSKPC